MRLDNSLRALLIANFSPSGGFCALIYTVTRLHFILLQEPPCLKRIKGASSASSSARIASACDQREPRDGGGPPVSGARNLRRSPASA